MCCLAVTHPVAHDNNLQGVPAVRETLRPRPFLILLLDRSLDITIKSATKNPANTCKYPKKIAGNTGRKLKRLQKVFSGQCSVMKGALRWARYVCTAATVSTTAPAERTPTSTVSLLISATLANANYWKSKPPFKHIGPFKQISHLAYLLACTGRKLTGEKKPLNLDEYSSRLEPRLLRPLTITGPKKARLDRNRKVIVPRKSLPRTPGTESNQSWKRAVQ